MKTVAKQDRPPNEAGASSITDHPFRPRRAWWERCVDCGLSEAAHATTVRIERYCRSCFREMASHEHEWCERCARRAAVSE